MELKEQHKLYNYIIEMHKAIFFKVARTYCRKEVDRQDLVQEMMIQVWRSLPKYNNEFKVTTWLYRIAINVAISFYRKNGMDAVQIDDKMNQLSDQEVSNNEYELQLLEQFINELKDLDKALMLLYLEEKSHAEIAEILGISAGNVGTKIGRIKDQLKSKFLKLSLTQ